MPSLIIKLKSPPKFVQSQITDELKNLTTKGYDVYVKIYDKLALLATDDENPKMTELKAFLNRDQLKFRACVEVVQTTLTDSNANFYDVNDALLLLKKSLAETIDIWGLKLNEITIHTQQQIQANASKKHDNHHIDAGQVCTEELTDVDDAADDEDNHLKNIIVGSESISIDKSSSLADSATQSKEEPPVPLDKIKENIDKKSILQIISQLIPSNTNHNCTISSPLPINEYHSLPTGLFPVLVCDQDLSSIIAYTLLSPDYLKEVDSNNSPGYISDSNNSPNLKRKSQDVNDDEKDSSSNNEKEKKSKQSSCITIQFNDPSSTTQFSCRIYFAKEFDNLRYNFLSLPKLETKSGRIDSDIVDKSENDHKSCDSVSMNQRVTVDRSSNNVDKIRRAFARSLNQSLRWNARGGKSGTNFSKTVDDRFVLKEMTKQDVSIFEQFAPNYFDYLNHCLTRNQTTLLAKILGVFRVTIKKKE